MFYRMRRFEKKNEIFYNNFCLSGDFGNFCEFWETVAILELFLQENCKLAEISFNSFLITHLNFSFYNSRKYL